MTPSRRSSRLPEEEKPSDEPQEEQHLGSDSSFEYLDSDRMSHEAAPAEEPSAEQVPSFDTDQTRNRPDEALSFPETGETEFAPLPARLEADEPIRLPAPRRRRRSQRLVTRPDASELGERLESIARRAAPTFDFFFFSILTGLIISVGYLLDSPPILLCGILVAPLMAPWMGAALAAATGEIRFLGQTLGGFFTALLMVLVTGFLAGLVARFFMPITTTQALLHAQLWPFDLLVLAIGTVILAITLIQSEEKPLLASLMVAYEVYLPVGAAGFGLGSGVENLWPQALLVLLVHLAISIVLALIVFYYMGFRPIEIYGYIVAGLIVVAGLAVFAGYGGLFSYVGGNRPAPTPAPPTTIAADNTQATLTLAPTPFPTFTHVVLVTPTLGITPSPTSLPTPVYGKIQSRGDGAVIRTEPQGSPITTVQNGYLVEILPDAPLVLEGTTWVRIRVNTPTREIVGWVQINLIVTATPAPATPTP